MKLNHIHSYFVVFCLSYFVVWTLIPSSINHNLDYDQIEQYVLGSAFAWGYHHPPLSFWLPAFFFKFFDNTNTNYYLLAQINVFLSFFAFWLLSKDFLANPNRLLVILFLMLIPFFNSFAVKYNANSAMYFPWAFSIYFAYLAIVQNQWWQWVLLGCFCALTLLTKYFALVLLVSLFSLIFIPETRKRWKSLGPYLALAAFLVVLSPHIFWLITNSSPLGYAESRLMSQSYWDARLDGVRYLLTFPLYLILIFICLFWVNRKIPFYALIGFDKSDFKSRFLWHLTIFPWLIVGFFSVVFNLQITGIWAMPIWLCAPLWIVYQLKSSIHQNIKKLFQTAVGVILFFACAVLTYHFINKPLHPEYSYPSQLVLQRVMEEWQQKSGSPLEKIITSSSPLGPNLMFYANKKIKIASFPNDFENEGMTHSVVLCDSIDVNCTRKLDSISEMKDIKKEQIEIAEKEFLFAKSSSLKLEALFIP